MFKKFTIGLGAVAIDECNVYAAVSSTSPPAAGTIWAQAIPTTN